MSNSAHIAPLVMQQLFTKTMRDLVEVVDGKLATLTHNINLNTDRRVEHTQRPSKHMP